MVWRCACGLMFLAIGARVARADVPIGGFIPLVGIGMTKEFDDFDNDPEDPGLPNSADVSEDWGSPALGPGSSAYFDLALLDTGAGAHILTATAASANGFAIQAEGLKGANETPIFGATGGQIDMLINDAAGIYMAGLGARTSLDGATSLTMNTDFMRGQTSVATLEAPSTWTLPNIIGLPMAAQHAIVIRNDQPQIFQFQGRTVRTPNVELVDLGSGRDQGIQRRTSLRIRPSASFIQGPAYFSVNFLEPYDDPNTPTVVENGAMYLDVDVTHHGETTSNLEFLFDTGADMTVVSEVFAASLGFDVLRDKPDFFLEVEGAGGVASGVKGFYADKLKIDAVGGSLILEHVPIAVLDVPNPLDPGNTLDAIIGTHVFTGRNLVIDAIPAAFAGGGSPSLYISDLVYQTHTWAHAGTTGTWSDPAAWSAAETPDTLWDAQVINVGGGAKAALVNANSTVYRMTVEGTGASSMTVQINATRTLTVFGETLLKTGGVVRLNQGGKLDAQFINIDGGSLVGTGTIFVGAGPIAGAVRNLSGHIAPDSGAGAIGHIDITGDLANLGDGTMAFDIAGAVNNHDTIDVTRYAFLGGTLQVSLVGFTPVIGNAFTLITADVGVAGRFDHVLLPAGFSWFVDYQPLAVVLKVVRPGDFDGSGVVNNADLTAWRAGYGTIYDGDDLLVWQRNLGAASLPVPEPASWAMVLATVCGGATISRGRARFAAC